jgi:rhamnosyltransferase
MKGSNTVVGEQKTREPLRTTMCPGETGAVIVFYHPDATTVARANRIAQWVPVVVIDNTPSTERQRPIGLDPAIELISNAANLGIATAINQGVARLIQQGFRFALVFDQDSEPSRDHIDRLPAALAGLVAEGRRVATVGPAYHDGRLGGVAPFVRFGMFRLKRIVPTDEQPVEVDFLISSGSCINLECWDEIGPMEDDLFIDFVDLEWCVRAHKRGFSVLGIPSVIMRHSLGDKPTRVFGRTFAMHSPTRHYYLFRNATALMCRPDMPMTWKTSELVKFPVRLVVYAMASDARCKHLKMAFAGIRDGLRRRLGALEDRVA